MTFSNVILDPARARHLLHRMQTIRTFETRVAQLFSAGELPGFVHSCAGQEATAVGVCSHLGNSDYITSTHRGHGHSIAKGISLGAMFAELYGKQTGACHGRGGSMHVADFSIGMLGANGIVGGGFGIATGAAFAIRFQRRQDVAVCTRCSASRSRSGVVTPGAVEAERLRAEWGAGAGRAVERARAGGGATLLNMETYRHGGHYVGDAEEYRSAAEVASFASSNDPIDRFVRHAIDGGLMAVEEVRDVVDEVERLVDEAHRFALQSPPPDPATALDDVWTTGVPR